MLCEVFVILSRSSFLPDALKPWYTLGNITQSILNSNYITLMQHPSYILNRLSIPMPTAERGGSTPITALAPWFSPEDSRFMARKKPQESHRRRTTGSIGQSYDATTPSTSGTVDPRGGCSSSGWSPRGDFDGSFSPALSSQVNKT